MANKRIHSLLIIVLCMALVLGTVLPGYAVSEKKEIVVGYIGYEGFLKPNNKNKMEGYAAEYLRKIEEYSNIEFKYVETSWDRSVRQLETKKIDLICSAKQTKENIGKYAFSSQPFGSSRGVYYSRKDDNRFYYDDYKYIDGKKFAFLKGGVNYEIFSNFAKRKEFTFKPGFYNSDDDMTKALKKGRVDIMVTEHLVKHDDLKLIGDFDCRPFYLMTYSDNNFMNIINDAMGNIVTENPYYEAELFEKYYGENLAIKGSRFTREEINFVSSLRKYLKEKNGKDSLRVGIILGNEPVSYFDDGKAKGIRVELLEMISKTSGIPFEYVAIGPSIKAIEYGYLRKNNIDLILVEDNEINRAYGEVFESGLKFTKSLDNLSKVVVAKKGFEINENKDYTFAYVPGSASMHI